MKKILKKGIAGAVTAAAVTMALAGCGADPQQGGQSVSNLNPIPLTQM